MFVGLPLHVEDATFHNHYFFKTKEGLIAYHLDEQRILSQHPGAVTLYPHHVLVDSHLYALDDLQTPLFALKGQEISHYTSDHDSHSGSRNGTSYGSLFFTKQAKTLSVYNSQGLVAQRTMKKQFSLNGPLIKQSDGYYHIRMVHRQIQIHPLSIKGTVLQTTSVILAVDDQYLIYTMDGKLIMQVPLQDHVCLYKHYVVTANKDHISCHDTQLGIMLWTMDAPSEDITSLFAVNDVVCIGGETTRYCKMPFQYSMADLLEMNQIEPVMLESACEMAVPVTRWRDCDAHQLRELTKTVTKKDVNRMLSRLDKRDVEMLCCLLKERHALVMPRIQAIQKRITEAYSVAERSKRIASRCTTLKDLPHHVPSYSVDHVVFK